MGSAGGHAGNQSLYKQCQEQNITHSLGSLGGCQPGEQWEEFVETGAKAAGQAVGGGAKASGPLPLADYTLVWRCNLHIKFTHCICTIQWFLVHV